MVLLTKYIQSVNDLFDHQLRDIYYAQQQIMTALPKIDAINRRAA